MMLKDSFYKVLTITPQEEGLINNRLLIDKDHAILGGHFPGFPVVPGVCMMQIVKEQLESKLNRSLQLVSGGNIKFLSLINPVENAEIEVVVKYSLAEDGTLNADSSIIVENQPFFKIAKAVYK
jgi:3-hydroxyacyl-[acyl-carrier-protein] dehydratase